MLIPAMKPPGTYKRISRNRAFDTLLEPYARIHGRSQRILDSLRSEILGAGPGQSLRIRQIFENPREIFRVELEVPELNYQRTTLLDRDALEELLESDEVRGLLEPPRA